MSSLIPFGCRRGDGANVQLRETKRLAGVAQGGLQQLKPGKDRAQKRSCVISYLFICQGN